MLQSPLPREERALVLSNQRLSGVHVLLLRDAFRAERLVALKVEPRVVEQSPIA